MTKEKEGTRVNARELTLDILMEILERGALSHVVLRQALDKYQYLDKQDRALITRLTDGTLEYLIQIDYILGQYSRTPVSGMKPLIRTLLRMSVYQILYMDRIPDSAVCNEAVKLAQKRHFHGLKGFVNGVLRTVAREKGNLEFPDESIRYGMPRWILELWRETYPEETVRAMMSSFLEKSPFTVRLSVNRAGRAQILESLARQGVTVKDSGYTDDVVFLEGIDYLEKLEAFCEGWIHVQDLGAAMIAAAAAPQKGDYCIDVCGAPGGKSLHVADLLDGTGFVEVRDLSPAKVALIQENIDRSGYANIKAVEWDALVFSPESAEKADLLIADLPCSGLGILGRKPDIKYRMTPEAVEELVRLQRRMLSVVWQYVKPGGTLVYSTCTVDKKENEENAAWFVENYPFRAVNIEGRLGEMLQSDTMKQGYLQLLPGTYPGDGFFLAVFERI
ncbi:MAG: 16S rRNA (cytosine(967)-C(5))-methyltransferase RsmB [Hungatella sp.]|nr:16S rRNA (cytosine(967)-C(5))-methyltransferase RsmB [Hungatella sp.]